MQQSSASQFAHLQFYSTVCNEIRRRAGSQTEPAAEFFDNSFFRLYPFLGRNHALITKEQNANSRPVRISAGRNFINPRIWENTSNWSAFLPKNGFHFHFRHPLLDAVKFRLRNAAGRRRQHPDAEASGKKKRQQSSHGKIAIPGHPPHPIRQAAGKSTGLDSHTAGIT